MPEALRALSAISGRVDRPDRESIVLDQTDWGVTVKYCLSGLLRMAPGVVSGRGSSDFPRTLAQFQGRLRDAAACSAYLAASRGRTGIAAQDASTPRRSTLEAMACGAAVLLDPPVSPEELAKAVAPRLDDDGLRADLVARGRARVGRFDWRATARLTHEVYERCLGG